MNLDNFERRFKKYYKFDGAFKQNIQTCERAIHGRCKSNVFSDPRKITIDGGVIDYGMRYPS